MLLLFAIPQQTSYVYLSIWMACWFNCITEASALSNINCVKEKKFPRFIFLYCVNLYNFEGSKKYVKWMNGHMFLSNEQDSLGVSKLRPKGVITFQTLHPHIVQSKQQKQKKKSCSFENWQNCRGECPEQHTKSPCQNKVSGGKGAI